jgi:succinylglutamate desuccinylase
VGSDLFFWLNSLNLAMLLVAYEIEKTNMLFFLQTRSSSRFTQDYHAAEVQRQHIELERDAASKVSKELRGS